jgi:carbamoyl-phosphate synthase large subunit
MPKREDLKSILIVGSGPIVIGQACEFDYSGSQACKSLKEEGYRVILINSNPATIMTDPELADSTYIEPITPGIIEKIIERERPDAVLPTVGGQTALNVVMQLEEMGIFKKYGVELIGANIDSIRKAEDRDQFKKAMVEIGLQVPESNLASTIDEAMVYLEKMSLPIIIRPAFTLGGTGGNIVYNREDFHELVTKGLDMSPISQVLLEESVIGWKEFELEVMRDTADNRKFRSHGHTYGRLHHGSSAADSDRSGISGTEKYCHKNYTENWGRYRRLKHTVRGEPR